MYPIGYRMKNQAKPKANPINWWCAECIELEPNQEKRLAQIAMLKKQREDNASES